MPDITMCANKVCPLRKTCYRYMAIPDKYQSYSEFQFQTKGKKTICDNYDKCQKGDKLQSEVE